MRRHEKTRTGMLGGGLLFLGLFFAVLFSLSCESDGVPPPPELTELLSRGALVPFSGERNYENRYDGKLHGSTEWVASDGKGAFSATLLGLDGLTASAYAEKHGEQAWKTAQTKFNLFAWYASAIRDFQVRDPKLFMENYRLLDLPKTGNWMGKETIELVLGRPGTGRRYELSIDKEKGIALRFEEKSSSGEALARLQYSSIRHDEADPAEKRPDMIKRPKEDPLGAEPAWKEAAFQLGFNPYVPHFLPDGFRRQEAKILTAVDGSRSLLDLYTDGVEVIAVRQRIQPFSIVFSQEELDAVKAQGSSPARRFAFGPVTVLETYVGDLLISVTGKLGPEEMLSFVESFAPVQ